MTAPAARPLSRWELAAVLLLGSLVVGFGYLTVRRAAYTFPRMTDQGVYARAAWAVRDGGDPYAVTDEHGWHYTYPPFFVLLFTPLADPPPGADRFGYLPFAAAVAVWYGLNVVFAAAAVHLLAVAALPDARPGSRRWWYARLIPFDVCLPAVGYTLGRGQANVVVVVLLAAGFLAAVRRRGFASGVWVAAAACVKVIPGLLVLFPLLRGRWREWLGVLAGGVLFLLVIPALVWGPRGAVGMNETFLREVVFPGLTNRGSKSREPELIGTKNTDSQAFHAVVHALRHPDRATRPTNSDGLSKAIHYLIGLGMIGATGWAWRRAAPQGGVGQLLLFGCLCVIMIHLAPASHMHFYAFALPLVAGLVADDLRRHPGRAVPTPPVLAGLLTWTALTAVPLLDTWPLALKLRDFGLAVGATVGLWGWGVVRLAGVREVPLPGPAGSG
jgi:hypothetical protein